MSTASLVTLYQFAHTTITRNLDSVTESEALVRPEDGGNCINWIVGHLLLHRDRVHDLLGLPAAWSQELGPSDLYRRGATGIMSETAVPLATMRAELTRSQEAVLERLPRLSAQRLAERATNTMTVEERLAFFGVHEGYHAGQVGLLRRLLGKAGAIA